MFYIKQTSLSYGSLQQIDNTDHCTDCWRDKVMLQNSKGSDIRGHGAGEGHTMSRCSFFSGVWWSDGASQWRRGGWTAAACVSPVEARQQPVLFLLHLQPVFLHQFTGNAQSPLLFYFCSPFLWIILNWFGAKNPVCEEKKENVRIKWNKRTSKCVI